MKSIILAPLSVILFLSCNIPSSTPATPESSSGVKKVSVAVKTDLNGKTVEQNNIIARLEQDNKPGSIKHLYIISAYSGQVLIYSTVKGKVTSSGKRLTPLSVVDDGNQGMANSYGFNIDIDGSRRTTEVLQDDGTYGNSVEYLYWFDSKGVYHQQYVTGGMILHISSEPLAVKSIVLNLENTNDK